MKIEIYKPKVVDLPVKIQKRKDGTCYYYIPSTISESEALNLRKSGSVKGYVSLDRSQKGMTKIILVIPDQ